MKRIYYSLSALPSIYILLVFSVSNIVYAEGVVNKTPSHVFQMTENIIAEIKLIRDSQNVDVTVREVDVQTGKKPIHVYAKSLEVMEKISRTQEKYGLQAVAVGQIPLKKISPGNVYNSTQAILIELARIKSELGIEQQKENAAFVPNKTPSNVYQNFWYGSSLMDGLAGQISPGEVYHGAQIVLSELKLIAENLDVEFLSSIDDLGSNNILDKRKTPTDVNIEAFKNLYRIVSLEKKLQIGFGVPNHFPAGNILPSDVFDTTNNALAELVRIKVSLGISQQAPQVTPAGKKTSPEVFLMMQLIGVNLLAIANS